jgi:hypothetical protein
MAMVEMLAKTGQKVKTPKRQKGEIVAEAGAGLLTF